jgi:hypothetical protein
MTRLKSEVFRSGETVSYWNHETNDVEIDNFRGDPSKLEIRFKLASKGGGVTDVSLRIEKLGFDAVLNEMWKIDPEWVVKLMARQLNGHFWPE